MSQQAHWSTIKERGSLFGIRCLVAIYKVCGKRFFQVCFFPVMLYFYLTGGQARRGILKYWHHIEQTRNVTLSRGFALHRNGFKLFHSLIRGLARLTWLTLILLTPLVITR